MQKVDNSEKTFFWEIHETRDHPSSPGSGKSGVSSPARDANSRQVCLYLGHNSAPTNGFIWSDVGPMQQQQPVQLQLPPDTWCPCRAEHSMHSVCSMHLTPPLQRCGRLKISQDDPALNVAFAHDIAALAAKNSEQNVSGCVYLRVQCASTITCAPLHGSPWISWTGMSPIPQSWSSA